MSSTMTLTIRMDMDHYWHRNRRTGIRHEQAIQSIRGIFENLHRIEDLTIRNWPRFLENPWSQNNTHQAPVLRRLVLTTINKSDGYKSADTEQFPLILHALCPLLEVLVLHNFSTGKVSSNMRTVFGLREFYLDKLAARMRHTPPDDLISLLGSLPLLRTVSLAQCFPASRLPYPNIVRAQKTAVLPKLRSLTLTDLSIYLLRHLELPSCVDLSIRTRAHISNMMEPDEGSLVADLLTSYISQATCGAVAENRPIYKVTVGAASTHDISFQVTRCSTTPTGPRTIWCAFSTYPRSRTPTPVRDLCRAIQPLYVQTLEVAGASDLQQQPILGFNCVEDWSHVMQIFPLIETLQVEGKVHGEAAFNALREQSGDLVLGSVWPIQMLKKLTLRLTLRQSGFGRSAIREPRERMIDYVAALVAALSSRKERSLVLAELEIHVRGTLPDNDLAPLVPLVTRLTVDRIDSSLPVGSYVLTDQSHRNNGVAELSGARLVRRKLTAHNGERKEIDDDDSLGGTLSSDDDGGEEIEVSAIEDEDSDEDDDEGEEDDEEDNEDDKDDDDNEAEDDDVADESEGVANPLLFLTKVTFATQRSGQLTLNI